MQYDIVDVDIRSTIFLHVTLKIWGDEHAVFFYSITCSICFDKTGAEYSVSQRDINLVTTKSVFSISVRLGTNMPVGLQKLARRLTEISDKET